MKLAMTGMGLINLINIGFKYVIQTSNHYNIDESHALKHSMEVYTLSKKIYESEIIKNPKLEQNQAIIYMAAIGHDMCDKKYMDEKEGINNYKSYLSEFMSPTDLDIMGQIIGTMSYSKVKVNGFPNLGEYLTAYHIVREADLLAAYDIDRCIIYGMYRENCNYTDGLKRAVKLFDNRVFKMREDGLFITDYSKKESLKMHNKAKNDVESLIKIINQ
jgi:hypothetical protein